MKPTGSGGAGGNRSWTDEGRSPAFKEDDANEEPIDSATRR
jgi:hypothetical protein